MRNAGKLKNVILFTIVLVVGAFTSEALAQATLDPGDIIVANFAGRRIVKVDPDTGAQTLISSGGVFQSPFGIAIDAAGKIIVASDAGIISVDPVGAPASNQTVISSFGNFINPRGVTIDAFGNIIVADATSDLLIRVDPRTGTQTIISSGGLIALGVAIEASGDIIVPIDKEIIRVDPVSGAQTSISKDGIFKNLEGVAIDAAGKLIVTNGSTSGTDPRIISVDPVTGDQTVISRNPCCQGAEFHNPFGVAIDAAGDIIVADWSVNKIVRVDPLSGVQTIISRDGLLNQSIGVAIVPTPEAPSTAEERIDALLDDIGDLVTGGTVNAGQGNALSSKLDQAQKQLGRARIGAAIGQLGAFINQVNAFIRSGKLTEGEGLPLSDAAAATIIQLAF